MNIMELKEQINNNTLEEQFLILKYVDNSYIAYQYINKIAMNRCCEIDYIPSLDSLDRQEEIFNFTPTNLLSILTVEKLESISVSLNKLKNCIVCCKDIEKSIYDEFKDFIVEIPKLENWQIEEYLKFLAKGLSSAEIEWLCSIANYNIYRLKNEIDKISIFNEEEQKNIFNLINEDNGYIDLCPLTIFNLTNAIVKKDLSIVKEVLESLESLNIEPLGVLSILITQFKHIISIQLNSNASAEKLNMTNKQFYAIRQNCGKFSNEELIDIYELLTSLDKKIKVGDLPIEHFIEYILVKIL